MQTTLKDILTGVLSLFIVFTLFSFSINHVIIKPRLYDGTVNDLGRYSFTFDAYEHIKSSSDAPVIALGSSKMREIFDGHLIGQNTEFEGDFFNLAYASDRPYVRMIEIDAIIQTNPTLVMIELGPNMFSSLADPVPESTLNRMTQLMALNTAWEDASWNDIVSDEDRKVLPETRFEQLEYFSTISSKSIESTLAYALGHDEPPYSCDTDWGTVHCVPLPNEPQYADYVKYPIQFRNSLKVIKAGNAKYTIEEFYGERLDNYLSRSYHNPEGVLNKNQLAYEFIIESLLENEIPVMLVNLPYSPVLIDRLSDGQWDYLNSTIETYSERYDLEIVDYMWSNDMIDDDFNDYTHAARSGEVKFAGFIGPKIDNFLK
jgi:hypothetical protein